MFWIAAAWAITPPSVERPVVPRFPQEALASGERSTVRLQLVVQDDGTVRDVTVVDSAGAAFDQAALDSMRAMRFTPAVDDDGSPIEVEILYDVVFDPVQAPPPSIEGEVRELGTRAPLERIRLKVSQGDVVFYATTDADGRFVFAGLAAGVWLVEADSDAYTRIEQEVQVVEGKVVTITLRTKEDRPWLDLEGFDEVVVVQGTRVAAEVSERVLTTKDIQYLPGTGGDLVKAVQNLPGVARPPFNIGQLIIRGTAPEDSAYYLDGARLPAVFHFAGLSTVLNGDTLEDVALLSGNYGARFGRTLGGLVDLRVKTALPERSNGYVSVDLLQTTAFVEQKLGDNTALTVSGRRSYIDAVLTPVLSAAGSATVRAPRYYDLQTRLLHHTDQGVLDFMVLVSDDAFSVVGDTEDPDAQSLALADRFQKFRFRWTAELGKEWSGEVSTVIGPESRRFDLSVGQAVERRFSLNQRMELRRGYGEGNVAWRMGLDLYTGLESFDYDIEDFGVREKGAVWFTSPSPYLEPTFKAGPMEITTGLRVDPWILEAGYTAVAVDPRLVARLRATPTTRFKAAVGQFSQFPGPRQVLESQAGNPDLGPARAIQASVGLEQAFGRVELEVTAFGSLLDNLIVGREDAFRFFTGPPPTGPLDTDPYANEGVGRVAGMEMLARYTDDRTVGWLSATVSRSTRTNREGDKEALFRYDQPVILTALVSREFGKGWRLGGRARFGSGSPFNPVVNRVYDLDDRSFQPVYSTESERLPNFFSLDVRIDKEWTFKNWAFATYVDVQNATNRGNVDLMGWTDDFEQQDPITGLPIVPAFGLKGSW